jgi:HTH-type transcriptional regulator/antitoxin HigA
MADRTSYRFAPDVAIPPGETIAEILQERGVTQSDFALMLGRTEKNVSQLVNGKAPVSPELAIDLERVLGVPAAMWNNLESTYRDLVARGRESARPESDVEWAKTFPLKYLRDNDFIARETGPSDRPGELLDFFGVASPTAWRGYWTAQRRLAARATTAYAANLPALSVWLRAGELAAREVEVAPYDAKAFERVVAQARTMTRGRADDAFDRLAALCADAGVALVLVPEPPKIGCHGVSRWLSDDRAVIQLCLRYKTADQLWFSFFHEACHVLRHNRKRTYVEDMSDRSVEEVEANEFAAETLIPASAWSEFVSRGTPSKAAVRSFAVEHGVDPGIVVGRLQHEGVVPFSYMNDLKTKLAWVLSRT